MPLELPVVVVAIAVVGVVVDLRALVAFARRRIQDTSIRTVRLGRRTRPFLLRRIGAETERGNRERGRRRPRS